MVDVEAMAKRLVEERGSRTQKFVAKELGISQGALAMYESGDRVPRDEVKEKIAAFYQKTVGGLFFGEKVHDM